jgi:protocatechuate 3,4-dioxygenase beta subunit
MIAMGMRMLTAKRLLAAMLVLLTAGLGERAWSAEPAADVEALVRQLRDDDYDTRQAAAGKLAAIGEAARAALETAAASQDPEWRKAALKVLGKLDVASITILAFDRDGKPASGAQAGASFFLLPPGAPIPKQGQTVTIGNDGAASIGALTPGDTTLELRWQRWSVVPEGKPYGPQHVQRGANPEFVRLADGGTLTFRVKDTEGRAVKGAQVYSLPSQLALSPELLDVQVAWLRSRVLASIQAAESDIDGVVKAGVPQGLYQCLVVHDDDDPCLAGSFRMDEGATVELATVVLTKAGKGKLAFTLMQADGKPLRKSHINADVERVYEGPKAAELARRARAIKWRSKPGDAPRTDDAGRLTLDGLAPGKYRLKVSEGGVLWDAGEWVVAGEQTTDAGTLKPSPAGSIKGKVVNRGGGGIERYAVQAVLAQTLAETLEGSAFPDWNIIRECFARGSQCASEQGGAYELRGLPPGTYAVAVMAPANDEPPVLICGLDVAVGKSAAAPDAVFSAAPVPAAGGAAVKGTVSGPDGNPAAGARASLFLAAGGQRSAECNAQGAFAVDTGGASCAGAHLVVKMPGCQPASVDLGAPTVKLDALDIRLEAQRFGAVRVRVVDEGGKPLSHASVVAYWIRRVGDINIANPSFALRKVMTNADGQARLTGLAAGERRLAVQCDGYYVAGEPKVTVVADADAEAVVPMARGIAIAGRVEWPEGCGHTNTVVTLFDGRRTTQLAKEDGSFDFGAFAPGDYYVSAAAPGLIVAEHAHIRLAPDTAAPELRLKLVRPAGVVVDSGLDGATVTLVPKGRAEQSLVSRTVAWADMVLSERADAAGRAKFWGLPAGDYDALVAPEIEKRAPMSRRWTSFAPSAATLLGGTVTATPLKNAAELRTLPGVAVPLAKGTARVYGRVTCDQEFAAKYSSLGQLDIKLLGAAAMASYTLSYPDACRQDAAQKIQVLQGPADGPLARLAQPGMFAFEGVPAGDYKVIGELRLLSGIQAGGLRTEQKLPPVALGSLTVKPNEALDAGTLRFDPPADMPAPQETAADWRRAAEPDDQAPAKRP